MRFLLLLSLFISVPAAAAPWVWQRQGSYIHDVAVASDGAVAAFGNRALFVFGPNGKPRGEIGFGSRTNVISVAVAPDRDILVAGYFVTEMTIDRTKFTAKKDQDGFIARFKPDGTIRWVVQVESDDTLYMYGVAATADRVVATGWSRRGKARVGSIEIPKEVGIVIVLDNAGKVLKVPTIDMGYEGELLKVCATNDSFVVIGRDRTKRPDRGYVGGVSKDGQLTWSLRVQERAGQIACRTDGTSYFATHEDDLVVYEFDRAGKQVRKISVATEVDDQPLQLSVSKSELVISSRHTDRKAPLWSRISRFSTADGKLLGSEDFKGSEAIYMKATHGPTGLVYFGEVTLTAKATIRGTEISGARIFVSVP